MREKDKNDRFIQDFDSVCVYGEHRAPYTQFRNQKKRAEVYALKLDKWITLTECDHQTEHDSSHDLAENSCNALLCVSSHDVSSVN